MNQRYWSSRIQGLVPYTPGEQPKDRTFIKLNTNENPYPPSPRVLEAIRREADQRLRLYPDPESAALRGALAEHYGVEPGQVFCGNGSDEVLGLCFYALFSPGRKVVFPDITYSFYPVYTELFGLDYEEIPLNEDFTLPVERFLGGNGGAVICNPNAPTGRALPLSVELIDQYPNLLVVRTMSKSRSLAGMRIGYALGSQDLIDGVNCVKNSFNSYPLDRLAQAAGEAAVRDTAYFEETRGKIMATRTWVTHRLREMGFQVHDSSSNFLFIAHPDHSGRVLQQGLRDRGVLVRRFERPRIQDHLRVSIGTDEEMEAMCRAMEEILKGQ